MSIGEDFAPSELLGQFGSAENALLASERCRASEPAFIAAESTALTHDIPTIEPDGKPRVAYCFDGSFLPIRNGCSYTLYNLMNAVADSGESEPFFVTCDRGTDETSSYFNQKFSSLLFHPDDYYGEGKMVETLQKLDVAVVQFYSSEGVLNLAPKMKHANMQTIFEVQNTDYLLLQQLGADVAEVEEARKKQIAAQKLADLIFVRSNEDAAQATLLGADNDRVRLYRGGIDVNTIEFMPERELGKNLVFLGHMHYAPNQRAVEHLMNLVMPQLDDEYKLTIIGVGPNKLVRSYESAGIDVYSVENISDELKRHNVALAPLTEGSGTRLKILDYLASGIPTISTKLGIEGLDDEIRNSVVVEDDIEQYSTIINDVYQSPDTYERRARLGRKFVERAYSWSGAVVTFTDAYAELRTRGVK